MKRSVHVFGVVIVCCAMATIAQATTITDDFSTAHDYSGGNVAGTIWDGAGYNLNVTGTGNAVVSAFNANSSNAGRLTLTSTYGSWEGGSAGDDGPILYKNVAGDFTAVVQVVSAERILYNTEGLIARVANGTDAGAGANWVAAIMLNVHGVVGGGWDDGFKLRSVDNDTESNVDGQSGIYQPAWLKLTRVGNVFTAYGAADDSGAPGTWSKVGDVTRTDMADLTLQVGIVQASYAENSASAQLDNFSLTTVPEPGSIALLAAGLLGLLAYAWRKRR